VPKTVVLLLISYPR